MTKTIKPAIAGTRVPYSGGYQAGALTERGARIEWDEKRKRPKLAHWTRYIAMGVVVVVDEVTPPARARMTEAT